jgi:APA family basic amino acid/polyamine antiporter
MSNLPRKLSFFDGVTLLVGTVIGSAIFVIPSLIAQRIAEPGLVVGIWVFSGLLVLCGALTLAELGTMLPQSGGLYIYMREAYGQFWAYLYGWTMMLVVFPGSIAALTSTFLLYLQWFVPLTWWAEKALGIGLLLVLAFVNTRGVKKGAGVQNLFTVFKVAGLVLLVGLAVITLRGSSANFLPILPERLSRGKLAAIGLSMVSTLFAYDGWQSVSFVAGEIRDPQKNIPRSIILGVLFVIAAYLGANLTYIFVLGQPSIAASERVAADAMSAMIGPVGATLITLAIVCSTVGTIAASILVGPRVFFAMARDGVIFPQLGTVHPRFETPANAIWAMAILAGLMTLTGGYEHLITMAGFANWIFLTMIALSVVVLRRKHPEWNRPYRVVGYPFTVLVFVIVSTVFVVNTLIESTLSSLMGLGLLLVGIPFYKKRKVSAPFGIPKSGSGNDS